MTDRAWQMISFYTMNTGYKDEVKKLIASSDKLNLPLHVFAYPPRGTWRRNLNFKSSSILEAFSMFPNKDIVFVDADAIIRNDPVLFDELSEKNEHDIAAHFYRYSRRSGDRDELLSGTLWINNNPNGRKLIERWHELGERWEDTRHQKCLRIAILQLIYEGMELNIYRLPFEYTCIFDSGHRLKIQTPVIEHFQASRRLRKKVGFGIRLINNSKTVARERNREMGFNGILTTKNMKAWKKRASTMKEFTKDIRS